ncbi:MAG: hypothetical protein WCJ35_00700 [Planctomycetota bacterium]
MAGSGTGAPPADGDRRLELRKLLLGLLGGDLVSCHCRMRTPAAWSGENSFHTTFWFARIEIFRMLPPPWFRFVYSDDGCEMLQCECQFFRDRALAAGFSVQSGGWCGHGCEAKWCG